MRSGDGRPPPWSARAIPLDPAAPDASGGVAVVGELTTGAREAIGDDEYEATVCAGTDLTWDEALQEAIAACEVASEL